MVNTSYKGKEKASCSVDGKKNTDGQVAINNNALTKYQIAQRARRERERLERTSGHARFFTSLTPSRRHQAQMEQSLMKRPRNQSTPVTNKRSGLISKQTMPTNIPVSASMTTMLQGMPGHNFNGSNFGEGTSAHSESSYNFTIFGHMDTDLARTVQLLRQKNVGVVIRDERDLNCLLLAEKEKRKLNAVATSSSTKGKGKGKENIDPQVEMNDNVLTTRQLAQRARRERERCQLKESTVHVIEQIVPIDLPESSSSSLNTMLRAMPPQNVEEGVTTHLEPHSRCSIEISELVVEQTVATNDVGPSHLISMLQGKGKVNIDPQVEINNNVLSTRQLAQRARRERERCQLKEPTVHVIEQIVPIDFPESSSVNTMLRGMPTQNVEEGVTTPLEPHSRV